MKEVIYREDIGYSDENTAQKINKVIKLLEELKKKSENKLLIFKYYQIDTEEE